MKMPAKGRSPTTRHVSWTHRVDVYRLRDRISLDPGIHIKYAKTSKQIADIRSKDSFHRERWSQLTHLFHLVTPHVRSCSHFSFCFASVQNDRISHRKRHSQTEALAQFFSLHESGNKNNKADYVAGVEQSFQTTKAGGFLHATTKQASKLCCKHGEAIPLQNTAGATPYPSDARQTCHSQKARSRRPTPRCSTNFSS